MMKDEVYTLRTLLNTDTGKKNYFDFEADFIEENVRCIPMIVRFKMDLAGIKLKLAEWSRFNLEERAFLAMVPVNDAAEVEAYHQFLSGLIKKHTGGNPVLLPIDSTPAWSVLGIVPEMLQAKANELDRRISLEEWQNLSDLQRFALLKLCRPGHENRNFPKAMREFGLT